jgi:glyoxylase-like metal-dependent hydrolase (beta-lactamase superfamily II)
MAHSVEVLLPAQRYVFALENGRAEPQPAATSAEGFHSYKRLQRAGKVAGMIAIPNCCLIRAGADYVVDPGVMMQGAPVTASLRKRGIEPHETKVILTHNHFDHVQALVEFAQRETYVHEIEMQAPYTAIESGKLDMVNVTTLTGDEGEIEPGVRWILTPGHSDGLISLLIDTDDGLVVIASDCVVPLPEYFDEMDLPEDFGPERDELLRQWARIRELGPHMVIPGHNPPVVLED